MTSFDRPCWEECTCCDDYLCNIHGEHAFECTCEGIEWWANHDMNPYFTTVVEYRAAMTNNKVENN